MDRTDPRHSPEQTDPRLHQAAMPRSVWVKDSDLHKVLIEAAHKGKWELLGNYLDQMAADERVSGAPLMRALNTPLREKGMPVLAVMISRGASLAMIERVMTLGAAGLPRFFVNEPRGARAEGYTLMHLALLSGRPELVSILPQHRERVLLENQRGECPVRVLARLASDRWLAREEVQRAAGIAARRYLLAGGDGEELGRAVSMLCGRNAWGVAEAVLDSWANATEKRDGIQVKGTSIAKWAWFAVYQDAPQSFFQSLHEMVKGRAVLPPLQLSPETQGGLLMRFLPDTVGDATIRKHDWSALSSRLEKLGACKGLIQPEIIRSFINANDVEIRYKSIDEVLERYGLIDPVMQSPPMSLFQAMLYGGAPRGMVELALELGADTTYKAWVGTPGETYIDGMALHIALVRGDLGNVEALIKAGAPLSQRNSSSQTELQYLFSSHRNGLTIEHLPLVEMMLRAGPVDLNATDSTGKTLSDGRISGFRFGDLMVLARTFGQKVTNSAATVLEAKKYQVLDGFGTLAEVNGDQLARIVEKEYLKSFGFSRNVDTFQDEMLPMGLMNVGVAREIAEKLHLAINNPLVNEEPPEAAEQAPPAVESEGAGGSSLGEMESFTDPDTEKDGEGEFLSFPDFGGAEHGFTYQDPEAGGEDEEYHDAELERDQQERPVEEQSTQLFGEETGKPDMDASGDEDVAESPLKSVPKGGATFEKSFLEVLGLDYSDFLEGAEDGYKDLLSAPDYDYADDFDDDFDDEYLDSIAGLGPNSYREGIKKALMGGELYEAYLLMMCLREVAVKHETSLSAISRSLQSLLYRQHPQMANYLVSLVDGRYENNDGYHPYMAEFLCLLNNPLDKRRDPGSIGGLTLGITGVARLMRFGSLTGELVEAWGRVGTWGFSFPVWRFDSQAILPKESGRFEAGSSLMELAGIEKVQSPVDEFWSGARRHEHLLGSLFRVGEGTPFHDNFNQQEAVRLGFARLDQATTVIFRRACFIISHPDHGTLVIRNSSHTFGRDRFAHPALWRSGSMSTRDLLHLRKEVIEREFVSIVGSDFFRTGGQSERPKSSARGPAQKGMTFDRAARSLNFLMDQATTVRASFSRMKFDANPATAWKPSTGEMVGGYRSPLFRHVVTLLEDRLEAKYADRSKRAVVPDLAFANPDYFPAPHARLAVTPESLDVLRLLADGQEARVGERQLKHSGVRDFLDTGFKRGRNSELILLPPETQ